MTQRKWNLRYSTAFVLALAIACGYWVIVGGCTTPEGGGATETEPGEPGDVGTNGGGTEDSGGDGEVDALDISEATCEPLDDQAGGFEINLRAVSSKGRELSCTSRVITDQEDGSSQVETEVTADGELVISMITSNGPVGTNGSTSVQVQIEYGPLVPGISSATAVVEDGVVSGTVDGRAIVPMSVDDVDEFDATTVTLEDGAPPPEVGIDADLEAAVADLLAAAATTAEGCSVPNGNDVENAEKVIGTGLKNTGHYSETVETWDCAKCWGKCISTGVACNLGVAGGCVLSFFGYGLCLAAGYGVCTADQISCEDDCYDHEGGCCPVGCYTAFLVDVCCLDGETCLNDELGTCCGPGETPCSNKYCCEGTEECINDSRLNDVECCEPQNICGDSPKTCCNPTDACIPDFQVCCPAGRPTCFDHCCDTGQVCVNTSVCCEPANVCNDLCCTDEEVCNAGACCLPNNVCGSACCDDLDAGCIPELSLCCGFDRDACGSTCCPIGESCVGGTACCPDARICGDVCCPEGNGCDTQTDQCTPCPNPTDTPCLVGGCCPADKVCSDEEGVCCDPGEIYCCKGPGGCGCKLPHLCVN